MSNITIDISKLTPQQAFELGQMLNQAKPSAPKPEVVKPRYSKNPKSKRFRTNVNYPDVFIEELIRMKQEKRMTSQEIADQLNASNIRTASGKQFWGSTVWDIIYSKQAKKMWLN